jgi:hypothetical protein
VSGVDRQYAQRDDRRGMDRPASPPRRRRYWFLLALALLLVAALAGWLHLSPGQDIASALRDAWYRSDFVPAKTAIVSNAVCTDWRPLPLSRCYVNVKVMRGGESRELKFWRFGRSPGAPVQILENARKPGIVTTSSALAASRFAFLAMPAVGGGLVLLGTAYGLWRRARRKLSPPR